MQAPLRSIRTALRSDKRGELILAAIAKNDMAAVHEAVLCFVDLDEFARSEAPGQSVGSLLRKAFARCKVGAVGMHWRLFKSNGHVAAGPEPVAQRFMTHASDTQRSSTGRASSHVPFEAPLQPGDVVPVRACANPTALVRNTHVIG